ncbi:YncE family protein [Calidifontibacillus oryziterrae]|uniref:YncE family protein n=1 Tax=Calidifontibacillus oryziterrae TaxID=1191699 RepID=UPI0002F0FADF|nr:hypothetical protein [Calidifontibacillus oryziterrae]
MAKTRYFVVFILLLLVAGCQNEQYKKIDSDSPLIIIVNLIEKSLSFYNEETRTELARWQMPFTFTGALVLPDNRTLLLYGKHLERVYLYDLQSGEKVDEWKLGKGIANALLSIDKSKIYFADQENDMIIITDKEGRKFAEIDVNDDPLTLMESENEQLLYVLNFDAPVISVIDLHTNQVVNSFEAKQAAVGAVLVESLGELWTGGHGAGDQVENNVTVYSIETGHIRKEIYTPVMPVDLEKHGEFIYVVSHGSNQLRKINMNTKEVEAAVEIGANPFDISIYNNFIYSVSYDSNELIIVDPNDMKVCATLKTGEGPFQVLFRRGVEND